MTSSSVRLIETSTLDEIKSGNLYALLSVCTDYELMPLVDLIKDRFSSRLVSETSYKLSPSVPSNYFMAIGDEICLFGGDSIGNSLRGGGVEYREVVTDVCTRLGVAVSEHIVDDERALLELYLTEQWCAIAPSRRDDVIKKARDTIANQATSIETQIKGVSAKKVVGSLLTLNPITAFAALTAIAPAFRVTAPCVLHLAYLRRKVLEEQSPTTISSAVASVSQERSSTLSFSEGEGTEHFLALTRISDPAITEWQPPESDPAGISRFNPLLQSVPSLVTAQEVGAKQFMEVVINGPLLKAKGQEGYRLITMIDGKPSHGVLLKPDSLAQVINAAAIFQIVSVAVGQKHLADIRRELTAIKNALEAVSQFQQNQRASTISGVLNYLQSIAPAVFSNETPNNRAIYLGQLEHREGELLAIQDHLIKDIKAQSKAILAIKDPDTFGSDGLQKAIVRHHQQLSEHYRQALLCVRARAATLQLASALGLAASTRDIRATDIRNALIQLGEQGSLVTETNNMMRQKIQSLSAMTDKSSTIVRRKVDLLGLNDQLLHQITLERTSIETVMANAASLLNQEHQINRLFVRVEENRITGLQLA